ncbi:valine--tRNA ligase [Spirulina subsalsa FACHB-351]|uniref:Valine--tRNA ligase n=1 Tax=Spirulina subsalsa FACHB-351 TaxID=234711 RepID=A0ABT3LCD6_9CYAN|nr:valine--tRNA ligase [Spirulina subsalsa]MCW6038769.1 valine--tRNA ligase [Spirulina subsalsa FACHB-351]
MTAKTPTLATQYDPVATEAKWQQYWEEHHVFQADPSAGGETYSIVIPPPNVTGSLHMGHAFNTSLLDTLVRYHRMLGKNTLCLPGTDHASIAVQTILERQLREEGKTRDDIGREKFLERAWAWRESSGGTIVNQLRRIGLSADWSRERFTMDSGVSEAVLEAFVRLYDEGLIYRGQYMVNWCPASQSAVSDLEVENKEVDGFLWYLRYPLSDGSGSVEVATTRPETMLGDTGVAVNPQDPRYQSFIGKTVTLPIVGRKIPIFADELVDPEFGTGCVKVTPAHDPNDFEMGKRHHLPFINILNKDGTLNENAGEFAGQDRFTARKNLIKRLEMDAVLSRVEDYRHTVPYSDRGKVPVEPLLSTQWFVKIEPLAQKALQELDQNNSPYFVPERWKKVYRDWLVKLKDWCISRQLWWGHQIPAWYAVNLTQGEITDDTPFVVARSEEEAWAKAKAKFGEDVELVRDPDALDTWFSSGLWPFSTMGWPQETEDLSQYFPNSTLVTGFDIIFFWVARMTMMAGHFTGQMPFKDVYIHGLVRDENGKKMSKSAGNGIDPLLLINRYGADALRYTLIKEVAGAGQDISLQYDRKTDESESVEASRNFANKLWNASRFVLMNLDGKTPQKLGMPDVQALELSDRWILSRFYQVVAQTRSHLDEYGLGEAAKGLYDFIWGDFCDWYIELVKPRLRQSSHSKSRRVAQQTLGYVLEGILKLLHPFMPHITEELWHTLTQQSDPVLALQLYPQVDEVLKAYEQKQQKLAETDTLAFLTQKTADYDNPVVQFLADLPVNATNFLKQNRRSLWVLGALILFLMVLRFVFAALDAINEILFLEPAFQLIGLIYSGWFVYRYLGRVEDRQATWERGKAWLGKMMDLTPNTSPVTPADRPLEESTPQSTSPTAPVFPQTLIDPKLEQDFELIISTIRVVRNLRAEAGIKPGATVSIILQSENEAERQVLTAGQVYIQDVGKGENVQITPSLDQEYGQAFAGVVGTIQVLIPLQGLVDIEALCAKLEKDLSKVEGEVQSLTARLKNPNFVNKAPANVVQGTRDALAEAEQQAKILRDRLVRLQ